MSLAADYIGRVLPESGIFERNPDQLGYLGAVTEALQQTPGRVHLIEGDAGIGKTICYLLALAEWVAQAPKQRVVVISTQTRSLQKQLTSAENTDFLNAFCRTHGLPLLEMGCLMGKSNYVDPRRLADVLEAENLEDVILDQERGAEERALARWAANSDGCLLDLDPALLPDGISTHDICLRGNDDLPPSVRTHRQDARRKSIIVVNHALLVGMMLARDELVGFGDKEVCLLLDESEHYLQAAASRLCYTLSIGRLARLAENIGYRKLSEVWQQLLADCRRPDRAGGAVAVDVRLREQLLDGLRRISKAPKRPARATDEAAEAWSEARHTARYLCGALRAGSAGVALSYSPVHGLPSIVRGDPGAGGTLLIGAKKRRTILTSATLSDLRGLRGSNAGSRFNYMLNGLRLAYSDPRRGLMKQCIAHNFGSAVFRVPDARMPHPLERTSGGLYRLSSEFARYAVSEILKGSQNQRVLVLCSSYEDTRILEKYWRTEQRGRLFTHGSGININALANALSRDGVLVTPAGWEGLSPDRDEFSFWGRIVILRNPRAMIDESQIIIEAENLRSRGNSRAVAYSKARRFAHARNTTQTLHRLRQGIGRGIRHPKDHVEVLFLDPRFPSPSQCGHSLFVPGLARAIPDRFRQDYVGDAGAQCDVVKVL